MLLALQWHGCEHGGDMDVPQRCVMWGTECRTAGLPAHAAPFRLGRTVSMIRSAGHYVSGRPDNWTRLEEMGVQL